MRDLAFAIFRIWAVAYGLTVALPSFVMQLIFLPSAWQHAEEAERLELAVQMGTYVGASVGFVLVLFIFARSFAKLVPDRPVPEITFNTQLVTTFALIIAGIALIATASGSLIVLLDELLQWANFKQGKPENFRGWVVEWQPVSQLIVGAAFLFAAGRR